MEDFRIDVKGFWNAGDVSELAERLLGVAIECTTEDGVVVVHPRPRALSEAELAQLEAALRASKPFVLSVDKPTIMAGGDDYATVTIQSIGDSVDVLVRDQTVTVPLADGMGTLHVAAQYPTLEPIVVKAADQMVYGFEHVEVKAI